MAEKSIDKDILNAAKWHVTDGRLMHDELPEPIAERFTNPYPPGIWFAGESRLEHTYLPKNIPVGAFTGCTELVQAVIPESVKYIGENAFAGTKLKSVKIAADCVYSETSFPQGCKVNFY